MISALARSARRGLNRAATSPRPVVATPHQPDRQLDALVAVDRDSHPAGVGTPTVPASLARSDQLVPERAGQRNVRSLVAVKMAQLTAPDPELEPTETVRPDVDSWPAREPVGDALARRLIPAHA